MWALAVDGSLHSFEATTGKPVKVVELPVDEDAPVTWDPVTRRATAVVVGEEIEVQIIDVDTAKVVGKLAVPPNLGGAFVAFCPTDKNRVAVFGLGSVVVMNATTGKPVRTFSFGKSDDSPPSRGAISPDGRLVAIATNNKPMAVWEIRTGKKRFEWDPPANPEAAVFSSDGRLLAAWNAAGHLVVFDIRLGTIVRRIDSTSPAVGGFSVAFSPDGKRIAIGERDGSVTVWDIASGEAVVTFEQHDGIVNGLAWSPDGSRLASASQDGTVLVWAVPAKLVVRPVERAVGGFDEAFQLLGSAEPVIAQRGMEYLYRRPAEVAKQCGDRITIPASTPAAKITKLVADLDDEDFPVRQAAVKELEAIGGEAAAQLRSVAEKSSNAEARKLATGLLVRIETIPPNAEELRALRAVEVLEHIATADARTVLTKWAGGPAGTKLTAEAAAAVARLKAKGN